jgi:class 3 adenylate cyclase/predicted ATPase
MDIGAWLRDLGLEQYEANFRDHRIDETVLRRLTAEDLKEAGVMPVGHRRKLLDAIAALVEPPSPVALAAHSRAEPSVWEAGRRQLTVLCCDLVNSTALAEHLDPEDWGEVVREVLKSIAAVADRFDGYVAKYTGDGALVYFGYPRAHEDDAERAVRAALGVIELVRGIGHARRIDLGIRMGIATGRVVVGELIGEGVAQERSVSGGTPALAARLQAVAQPGTVVIAPDTRHLLGRLFTLQALGPQALKGFAEPVEAWAVVGESPHVIRFEAARTGTILPLIGREREVALLFDRWRSAAAGEGRAVLLSGEAGIGKSRVAQALRELVRSERHWAVRYQCSPHHANEPFYPVIGQLWHAAGFVPGETPGRRLDKIEDLVDRSGLPRSEAVPHLATLLSVPLQGRYDSPDAAPNLVKERIVSILIAMLKGLAARAPVLFLLEDAHWIDPSTLEMMNRGIDQISAARVLCVITFRPSFSAPWMGREHVTAVALNRLARAEAGAMINAVVAGKQLPPDLVDQIVIKTDGVPLFIEELTKTVLSSGLIREENDAYVLVGPLTPLAIPSTLQDSLMARLDRLAPVREIAQIAAAIGREFSYRLIEAVAPMPPPLLHKALQKLVGSELVYRRGSADKESYIFKHALVQDTAYASLLRSRRHRIHADIARALTEHFPEEVEAAPEVIAHHYTEAGMPGEAARHWLTAAERSLARSANIEGARYAETGLALISQIPESLERQRLELGFQLARGNAFLAVKGYTAPETIETLTAVKRMLDTGLGDDIHRFSVLYGLWAAHYVGGRIEAAHGLAREYLEVATRQSDATFWVIGHRIVGAGLIAGGQHTAALRSLSIAEEHYDPARHRPLSYRFGQDIGLSVVCHQVWALWFLGKLDRAKQLSEKILAELPDHGHAMTVAFGMLYGVVFPAIFASDFERAARVGDDLVAFCTEQRMGPHYITAGRLCSMVGRGLRESTPAVVTAIQAELANLHDRFGVRVLDSPLSAALAQILMAAGDAAAADAVLRDAISFAVTSGERYWLPELHRLRGLAALRDGESNAAAATDCFAEAIAIAQQQEARTLLLRAASDLVRLRRATERDGCDARAVIEPLLSAMEGGEASIDVQNARALLA